MSDTSSRDEPCAKPVADTWRTWDMAGAWRWEPKPPWSPGRLADVVEALRPLARVRRAVFDPGPEGPPLAVPVLEWREATPHADFERALLEATKALQPIVAVDLELDLHVWMRTERSPNAPVRAWLDHGGRVALAFDEWPYGSLTVDHTLFIDGNLAGDPNTELHRLNQPLLRGALAAIEARLGLITEVEGLPGVTRTGFAPVEP